MRRLYISVWDKCNLTCSHCFNEGGKASGQILTHEEIKQIIAEAQESFGIEEVQLTGGEPTQRPDIFSIIRVLLEKNLKILLQTNGVFDRQVADEILQLPGDKVTLIISLDGIETNSYFRGERDTRKILDNIEILSKAFHIRINILLTSRIKWEEIEAIAGMARRFNLELAFNPICPSGRADASLLMSPKKYFAWMVNIEKFRKQGVQIRKCFDVNNGQLKEQENCPVRAGNAIFINADGHVYPCGFLINNPLGYIGSVRDTSLIELKTKIPRDCKILSAKCQGCEFHKNGYCHGGCPARIYALYRRFDEVDFYCLAKNFKENQDNE